MRTRTHPIVIALLALSLGASSMAQAQQDKDVRAAEAAQPGGPLARDRPDNQRGGPRYDQRGGPRYEQRGGPRYEQRGGPRYEQRGGPRYDPRADGRYDRRGPGAGPDHNYYRGGRLPPQWRGREYVVDDWRGHRLNQPPRGYHWVQTGADFVLVAIATGVIASIILNH